MTKKELKVAYELWKQARNAWERPDTQESELDIAWWEGYMCGASELVAKLGADILDGKEKR